MQLSGVSETLFIPLTARVLDSRDRATAFRDPVAERAADVLAIDLARYGREWTQTEAVVGRTAILDALCADFLARYPYAQVVSLGSGLCTRLFRVDDGVVRWVDVDLPPVIEVARASLAFHPRRVQVAGSVLEPRWHAHVEPHRPTLFIAEGLLMYLEEAEVAALLQQLAARYPGAEIALEGISPFLLHSRLGQGSSTIREAGARFKWGLRGPAELAQMVPGIEILDVRYHAEVYPGRWRWMRVLRPLRFVTRAMKVVHAKFPS